MEKISKEFLSLFTCLTLLLLLAAGVVQAQPSYDARVWIDPSSTTVPVGFPFSLDIETEILSLDLYSTAIGLSYNPSILDFTGATEGPFLRDNGDNGSCNNLNPCPTGFDVYPFPGYLEIYNYLTWPAVDGVPPVRSGTLATLNFNATGLGTSPVAFDWVEFSDSSYNVLNVEATGGSVDVVPEPATLLLLGSGLIPLVVRGVRKKVKKS